MWMRSESQKGLQQSFEIITRQLKNSTQAAEMTTGVGVRARVNVKIIVRDYWNNPGKKLCKFEPE